MLYFRNAKVLTPQGMLDQAVVGIENGRISEIISEKQAALDRRAHMVDANGLILSPGWIDLQFNGAFGHDFTADPTTLWEVAAELPRFGVTGFLPTIITAPLETFDEALRVLHQGPPAGWQGARPIGFHFEGPFLNPGKKGAHEARHLLQPAQVSAAGRLTGQWTPANGVRLVTLAPELDGASELIAALVKSGVVVSAGHSLATYEQARQAFNLGVRMVTHLFNAMPTLDHRKPGLVAAALMDRRVVTGLIVDGIHVHPGMVELTWQLKGEDRVALVTDAMAALGMSPGIYRLAGYEVHVDQISARLADGTLAGSILSPQAALQNTLNYTGCTLEQGLLALSTTPARLLGLPDRGVIQPGAVADLTLLSPNGELALTMVAGIILHQRKDLVS